MSKQQRTAAELADMISKEIGATQLAVGVEVRATTAGWQVIVLGPPTHHSIVTSAQAHAEQVADQLKLIYDLKT